MSNVKIKQTQEAYDAVRLAIKNTCDATTYNYIQPLNQTTDQTTWVNNYYLEVHKAICTSSLLPTHEILRTLFKDLTQHSTNEIEIYVACLTFVQKHFYHHFVVQPMNGRNIIYDPLTSLLLKNGRCGTMACFLIDLFLVNNIPARLTTGSCHTFAEAFIDGRWILADADLYPPAIYPKNESQKPLTLEEAIMNPALLDRCPSYINYNHDSITKFALLYPGTYSTISNYLRRPILPSCGYFGKEFFAKKPHMQRFTKSSPQQSWTKNNNFGWDSLVLDEKIKIVPVDTIQRPIQPWNIRQINTNLVWEGDENTDTYYEIVVSQESRKWSYENLSVGCLFDTNGVKFERNEPWIPMEDIKKYGDFVTIFAKLQKLQNEAIFYLPSNEAYIGDL